MKTVAVCEAKQRWFGMLCKTPALCLSLSEVLLVTHMPNGNKISTLLQVKEDKCARDIAYIELVSSGTQWVWSTPEYINPCQKESN